MAEKKPSRTDQLRLYQAAIQLKELAPWQWMQEDDIFGVQNPETDEIGFVSIMGMLGEHYSIALYLGVKGLFGFWSLQELGPHITVEDVLNIPHFQASFEDRDQLSQQDRDGIKDLGLKFRGRQAWPLFRSYRPGYVPWYLEADEARFLACVLEQVLDVAPRMRENPELLTPESDDEFVVRVPRKTDSTIEWADQIVHIAPPEPETISIPMDLEALAQIQQLPRQSIILEVDLFMIQSQIGERGERPRFGYVLLVMDGVNGFVLATRILQADPDLLTMYGSLPVTLVYELLRLQLHPATFRVQSQQVYELLRHLAAELGASLEQVTHLPQVEMARTMLMERL